MLELVTCSINPFQYWETYLIQSIILTHRSALLGNCSVNRWWDECETCPCCFLLCELHLQLLLLLLLTALTVAAASADSSSTAASTVATAASTTVAASALHAV